MSNLKKTTLSKQEKQWILTRRVTRLSDNKEVQIYPMGAERYLASVLLGQTKANYPLNSDVAGKDLLVLPGHGNSGFLMARAGAKSVTIVDKDPVTIAWIRAFKKYYHYRESSYPSISDCMNALTAWYPPLLNLPTDRGAARLFWLVHQNSLRRLYIHYMIDLVQQAVRVEPEADFELAQDLVIEVGTIESLAGTQRRFDTAFIPYLLGVSNGIETDTEIEAFISQLLSCVSEGNILVTPSRSTREFYLLGRRYFISAYACIQDIPGLMSYFRQTDHRWFRTQGLAVFSKKG